MYRDHFLDVNILIGSRIEWDAHCDKVTRYMGRQNIERCTSSTGFKSAQNHFNFIRTKGGEFLSDLSQKAFFDDDTKIRECIFSTLYDFAEQRRLSSTQFKKLKGFVQSVKAMKRLVEEIQKDKINGVRNFHKYMLLVIEYAIASLKRDCDYWDTQVPIRLYDRIGEEKDKTVYASLRQTLWGIIQDHEDVEIFLDCHDVQTHRLQRSICFVTIDKTHFLAEEIKPRIEAITPDIVIQSPNYKPQFQHV
jgi:hypothetical protein